MLDLKDYEALVEEAIEWRRHLHSIPELNFDLFETSAYVVERLKEFDVDEIVTGLGKTGVVALIEGRLGAGPTIGLRADMDALPIHETLDLPWVSKKPGAMHACGHDGHMAMLLGAAKHLAATRNFAGRLALIFQPAEEGGGGAKVMIDEGLMDRFQISQVFALHNHPGLPVGTFGVKKGPLLAAMDRFTIKITGRGGHAAVPDKAVDPVIAGAALVGALQTIASRNSDPLDSVVVSVTQFHAGSAFNIIPESVELGGTIRTLNTDMRDLAERRLTEISTLVAKTYGATCDVDYERGYPVTDNHSAETDFAAEIAGKIVGDGNVSWDIRPTMGTEDFAYMLEARPGTYLLLGNGNTRYLHDPNYEFSDEIIKYGIAFWVEAAETSLSGRNTDWATDLPST